MLICMSCNIEYREDKKFCNFCGSPLVAKEEPISKGETLDGKLICPHCKIVYEFGNTCIQCGSLLGGSSFPQTKEENEIACLSEAEEKASPVQTPPEILIKEHRKNFICPICNNISEQGKPCTKCGPALLSPDLTQSKEEPKIACGLEVEGKPSQVQTPQEPCIEVLQKKFICPTCKILYERGQACIRCGAALVTQGSSQEKEEPKLPETPEVNFSTPQPEGRSLLRVDPEQYFFTPPSKEGLGTPEGVNLSTPQPQPPDLLGVDSERPSLSSHKRQDLSPDHHAVQGLSAVEGVKKKEPEGVQSQEVKEEPTQTQPSEQQPPKRLVDGLERRLTLPGGRKKDYRRLFLEAVSIMIMVVAGGYFLWSIYSHLMIKRADSKAPPSNGAISQVFPPPSVSTHPSRSMTESGEIENKKVEKTSSIPKEVTSEVSAPIPSAATSKISFQEIPEIENIKNLIENIRQANLQKNIDLFLSCYSSDFKDREGKKKATLAYWKNFDYLDLSYDLKNPSISGETGKGRVEWLIKISPKAGGKPQESKTLLDVEFKKEDSGWKIKEVKQGV